MAAINNKDWKGELSSKRRKENWITRRFWISFETKSGESSYIWPRSSRRNCIQRTNKLLKERFRCLLAEIGLRYSPKNAVKIINFAYCIICVCIWGRMEFYGEELRNDDSIVNHLIICKGKFKFKHIDYFQW